jgi:hypothetical protein
MQEQRNWHKLILAHFEKSVYQNPGENTFGTKLILALKFPCANCALYDSAVRVIKTMSITAHVRESQPRSGILCTAL